MSTIRVGLAAFLSLGILGSTILFHRLGLDSFQSRHILINAHNDRIPVPNSFDWEREFSWAEVTPSKELVWHDCYPERQCARLIVPLDHSKAEGKKAVIALIRKPSSYLEYSVPYKGPILFNPGGPGGSGVDMIMGPAGDLLSTIVGPEFDVVGFDPRGIARSTPRISFFENDVVRSLWGRNGWTRANNSDEGVSRTLARAKIVGQLAADTDNGYLVHMNTDQTARDMLSIVEAHGRSKLQYWGFSYGSILGATFASIFPDRIERMIIDGVADSEDYYAVDKWFTSLIDADKVLEAFFSGCADTGPENCGFWAPTASDIRQNLTNLFDQIRARPLPIKSGSTYGILDYEKLKGSIFTSLYSPYTLFPELGRALGELAAGDGSYLYTLIPTQQVACSCNPSDHVFDSLADATTAIVCNDGEIVPDDIEAAEEHLANAMERSQWSDIWSGLRFGCVGWPKSAITQFRDPVTPLWAAKNMSRGFEGSIVLQQDSIGHCSISAPSLCTQRYVRRYFHDGTLPPAGTICEVLSQPFPDSESESVVEGSQSVLDMATVSIEDHKILTAIQHLSKIRVVTPFLV